MPRSTPLNLDVLRTLGGTDIDILCIRYLDALDDGDAGTASAIRQAASPIEREALDEILDGLINEAEDG